MQAIRCNQQEQRVLAKTLQTLELEEAYSLKLLQVDHRQLRLQQRNLKQRVGLIHSHLNTKDIADMRGQEADGSWEPPRTPVNISGTMRIAAAARRLNLNADRQRAKARSAALAGGAARSRDFHRNPLPVRPITASPRREQFKPRTRLRSSSVTGPFVDLSVEKEETRLRSYSVTSPVNTVSALAPATRVTESVPCLHNTVSFKSPEPHGVCDNDVHPGAATQGDPSATTDVTSSINPDVTPDIKPAATCGLIAEVVNAIKPALVAEVGVTYADDVKTSQYVKTHRASTASNQRRQSISAQKSNRPKTAHKLNYTSHKTEDLVKESTPAAGSCRRVSTFSDESLGNEIARQEAADARKDLLEGEQAVIEELVDKKDNFLDKVTKWVAEAPSITASEHLQVSDRIAKLGSRGKTEPPGESSRQGPVGAVPRERESALDQWKELRKCRYLRLKKGTEDYSGVNTLVKDQMQMFGFLRSSTQRQAEILQNASLLQPEAMIQEAPV